MGISPETGGLSPLPYGISGMIYFRNWPPTDSIRDLRLVAFKNYPSQSIVTEVLQGSARYTETLQPYKADSIAYTLLLSPLPPGKIAFIAVGQQFGPNVQADWRLVGEYVDTASQGAVFVPADSIISGINIRVDFNNISSLP